MGNSASNAITRTSGHIISEGENNRVRWNIGTTAGTYTVPWGSGNTNYFPLSFTTSAANGTGFFYFATMSTTAENSTLLPAGITHFNGTSGDDMSLVAVDRFWKIDAQSYTVKPSLSNLILTYLDAEFATPNKNAVETKLTARRWNNLTNTWTDYNTGGMVNPSANTITVASLTPSNFFPWWTISYPGTIFHWTSSVTANWNNASNWSASAGGPGGLGIPGPGDAVLFDDVRDGSCNLDVAADVAHLTMNAGYAGTFSQGNNTINIATQGDLSAGTFIGGAATMTVTGNLNLSGVDFTAPSAVLDIKQNLNLTAGKFNHHNGTIKFSGTKETQLISGSIASTFNHIEVTNASTTPGMRVETNVNLVGILTLGANVVVDADGASDNKILTLLSTADSPVKDAAIGILPRGASVTGKVTVQRFMAIEGPNNARIYRYIGSPVQQATVADLQQEIPVTGSFTGSSKCSGCGTGQSMFAYNESVIIDTNNKDGNTADDGYIDFPDASNTETMQPGRGYALFIRGNTMSSAKWDVRGIINAGNVRPVILPTTYTSSGKATEDGWNLVANPFPSTIDWSAQSGWTKTNIDGTIYTRDNGNPISRFATWNGVVGTNGGTRYIAVGQGFWVKANGSGSPILSATENVKAPTGPATFYREKSQTDVFRIMLVQGANSDEAIVHFRNDASEDFDTNADALKMLNSGFNLSTKLAGKDKLAINSISKNSCVNTIEVLAENMTAGNYIFNFSGTETFSNATTIILQDNFTGEMIDARARDSYAFSITADPLSTDSKRFNLVVTMQSTNTALNVSASPVCIGRDALLELTNTDSNNTYEAFMGNKKIEILQTRAGTIQWDVASELLSAGENHLVVRATPNTCGLSNEKTVMLNVLNTFAPIVEEPMAVCRNGSVKLSASGATEGSVYRWYEDDSDLTPPSAESLIGEFVTPVIHKSTTYFVSIVNVLGCEGERVAVPVEVTQYDDARITLNADSLQVNFEKGVQWLFNGQAIEGAITPSILPTEFGNYSVSVKVGSCMTTADYLRVEDEVTAIEDELRKAIHVYPNPVVDELFLQTDVLTSIRNAEVRNEMGEYVGKFMLEKMGNKVSGNYNMSALSSGLYVIEIVTDTGRFSVKIIKQ